MVSEVTQWSYAINGSGQGFTYHKGNIDWALSCTLIIRNGGGHALYIKSMRHIKTLQTKVDDWEIIFVFKDDLKICLYYNILYQ